MMVCVSPMAIYHTHYKSNYSLQLLVMAGTTLLYTYVYILTSTNEYTYTYILESRYVLSSTVHVYFFLFVLPPVVYLYFPRGITLCLPMFDNMYLFNKMLYVPILTLFVVLRFRSQFILCTILYHYSY